MRKIFGKLVDKLRNTFGKLWFVLVKKSCVNCFLCKSRVFFTNFYQTFSHGFLLFWPHKISWFYPFSTPFTVITNLNKGVL